jgi:hypothetical protein
MLSVSLWPKVISLSIFHCNSKERAFYRKSVFSRKPALCDHFQLRERKKRDKEKEWKRERLREKREKERKSGREREREREREHNVLNRLL